MLYLTSPASWDRAIVKAMHVLFSIKAQCDHPSFYFGTISPVRDEVHVVGLSSAFVTGDAPTGQRHEVILELVVKLAPAGQAPHTDRVYRLGRPREIIFTLYKYSI